MPPQPAPPVNAIPNMPNVGQGAPFRPPPQQQMPFQQPEFNQAPPVLPQALPPMAGAPGKCCYEIASCKGFIMLIFFFLLL